MLEDNNKSAISSKCKPGGGGYSHNLNSAGAFCAGKVSLLTPCYNAEKFLPVWADCILKQDYDKVEVIAINDGSADGTEKLLLEFGEKIRARGYEFLYLKKENGGAASAINMALPYVTGEYLMLYDADDILMPEAISAKARFLDERPDYGMARNNGYYVHEDNLEDKSSLFVTRRSEKENERIFDDLVYGRTNNWTASYMVRCEALFKATGRSIYVSPWGQNLQIMMPVAYFCKSGFIDRPLMCYVLRKTSVSHTNNYQRQVDLFNGYRENRREILRFIGVPYEARRQYDAKLEIMYDHIKLGRAASYGQYQDVKSYYDKLKAAGALTKKERVIFLLFGGKWNSKICSRLLAFKRKIWRRK